LRKEENLDLIKKLSQQNGNVDTSLLRSSKKLGRSREDRKEAAGRVLRQRRAGIGNSADDDKLFEAQREDSGDETSSLENDHIPEYLGRTPSYNLHLLKTPTAFGAGLKRPLDVDNDGQPVIKRRKRSKPLRKIMEILVAEETNWEGFASESDLSERNAAGITTDGESEDSAHSDHSEDAPSEGHWTDETSMEEDVTSTQNESEWSGGDEAGGNEEVLSERSSAFKAWATQVRNDVLGFTPSTAADFLSAAKPYNTKKDFTPKSSRDVSRETCVDPEVGTATREMNEHAISPIVPTSSRKVFNVSVNRIAAIQEARLDLPVVAEEQKIMEAIHNNNTTIIWGTTGSGKTTQVPQFLYEAGYGNPDGPTPGMIGVTQPRRVATVSMAKRVATELGNLAGKVSHQIRFDSSVSNQTAIKFMTDGVLLREVALDFTLSKYSAIIIDEAHERSVNTDLLIGMLSRVVDTRADLAKSHESCNPLKLIIMSATLRVADLTKNTALFRRGAPPIVQAEGRQYPVTMHFAKRTQRDYVEEMFHKVSRGHKKLPAGGMLVFLTGQNEITSLAKRLKHAFASTQGASSKHAPVRVSATEASIEDEDMDLDGYHNEEADEISDSGSEIRGVDNDDDHEFDIGDDSGELLKIHVLPLYSQLPTDQQMRVFEPTPDGSRLIVLATNVAETSLTISGLRYVFDCGRVKEKHFDRSTGVQSFDVGWISKASAGQRAGRAGRTGPGHCYRLYSSAIYERDFLDFTAPEIQRTPIEGVVLQLKSMGIPKVTSFPFPTPPDRDSLLKAERLLEYLRAIADGKVTDVGLELAAYPLSPRLSSMLVMGRSQGFIEDAITLVAALAVPDTFISENQLDLKDPEIIEDQRWTEADNQEVLLREQRRKEYHSFHAHTSRLDRTSDAVKLLTALCDFTHMSRESDSMATFRRYTRIKALHEASQLRSQLATIVATNYPDSIAISTTPEALLLSPIRANVHTPPPHHRRWLHRPNRSPRRSVSQPSRYE